MSKLMLSPDLRLSRIETEHKWNPRRLSEKEIKGEMECITDILLQLSIDDLRWETLCRRYNYLDNLLLIVRNPPEAQKEKIDTYKILK